MRLIFSLTLAVFLSETSFLKFKYENYEWTFSIRIQFVPEMLEHIPNTTKQGHLPSLLCVNKPNWGHNNLFPIAAKTENLWSFTSILLHNFMVQYFNIWVTLPTPCFNPKPVHLIDNVTMGWVFFKHFSFPWKFSFHQMLHLIIWSWYNKV